MACFLVWIADGVSCVGTGCLFLGLTLRSNACCGTSTLACDRRSLVFSTVRMQTVNDAGPGSKAEDHLTDC